MAEDKRVEQVTVEPEVVIDKKEVEEGKALAVISYFWLISLIVLLVKKDNEFVLFHAKQGFVLSLLYTLFFTIPILRFITWILGMIGILFAIIGAVKAYSGETWKMPFLGDFAQKIKF